jgi:glycosyltransferase involved in cell wall biosynthesis
VNIHHETGLVVPPADSAALADAMNRLAGDNALAKTMGTAARGRFEAHFTAAQMARAYTAIYRRVAAGFSGNAQTLADDFQTR